MRGRRQGKGRAPRLALAIGLGLLLVQTGCAVPIFSRSSYWDDLKNESYPGPESESEAEGGHPLHFLGVRVSDEVAPFQVGVKILHVFGSSPAGRAGLEVGDELRSISPSAHAQGTKPARIPVRSADDVRNALRSLPAAERETIDVVFARDGKERTTSVDLIHYASYVEERRKRMFAEATYDGVSFPFFFSRVTHHLTPAWIKTYFGATIDEPLLVDDDFQLFPILPGIAVMRRETVDLFDGSRHTLVTWPFRITTANTDRTPDLHDLIPPRPEHMVDL